MDKSRRSPWKVLSGLWSNYSFIFIFVVIFLAYYLVSPHLTWTGITNILRHSADVGIIALGMGLVVITGQNRFVRGLHAGLRGRLHHHGL